MSDTGGSPNGRPTFSANAGWDYATGFGTLTFTAGSRSVQMSVRRISTRPQSKLCSSFFGARLREFKTLLAGQGLACHFLLISRQKRPQIMIPEGRVHLVDDSKEDSALH
jgi:hypothetical protein